MRATEEAALAYIEREYARSQAESRHTVAEPKPLGALGIEGWRQARNSLARRGLIIRTAEGRWVPANAVVAQPPTNPPTTPDSPVLGN
jgi:hypothetical protein